VESAEGGVTDGESGGGDEEEVSCPSLLRRTRSAIAPMAMLAARPVQLASRPRRVLGTGRAFCANTGREDEEDEEDNEDEVEDKEEDEEDKEDKEDEEADKMEVSSTSFGRSG